MSDNSLGGKVRRLVAVVVARVRRRRRPLHDPAPEARPLHDPNDADR